VRRLPMVDASQSQTGVFRRPSPVLEHWARARRGLRSRRSRRPCRAGRTSPRQLPEWSCNGADRRLDGLSQVAARGSRASRNNRSGRSLRPLLPPGAESEAATATNTRADADGCASDRREATAHYEHGRRQSGTNCAPTAAGDRGSRSYLHHHRRKDARLCTQLASACRGRAVTHCMVLAAAAARPRRDPRSSGGARARRAGPRLHLVAAPTTPCRVNLNRQRGRGPLHNCRE
jgi:hypothetical protein